AVPQAGGAQQPAAYKGPPEAPGTAPSWRRKSSDTAAPAPTPVPQQPIVQTPFRGKSPAAPPPRPSRLPVFLGVVLLAGGVAALVAKPWQSNPVVATVIDAGTT